MASPIERDRRDERDFTDGLPPFAEVVVALAAAEPEDVPEGALDIDQLRVSFPVELEIEVDEAGRVSVRGSPPLVMTRTGFMPVFHQLTLRFVGGGAHGD